MLYVAKSEVVISIICSPDPQDIVSNGIINYINNWVLPGSVTLLCATEVIYVTCNG